MSYNSSWLYSNWDRVTYKPKTFIWPFTDWVCQPLQWTLTGTGWIWIAFMGFPHFRRSHIEIQKPSQKKKKKKERKKEKKQFHLWTDPSENIWDLERWFWRRFSNLIYIDNVVFMSIHWTAQLWKRLSYIFYYYKIYYYIIYAIYFITILFIIPIYFKFYQQSYRGTFLMKSVIKVWTIKEKSRNLKCLLLPNHKQHLKNRFIACLSSQCSHALLIREVNIR